MKFIKIKAELGQCYFNSFAFLVANAMFADSHQLRYVQGVVTSTAPGHDRIGHCWVELADPETGEEYVMEPVPHGLIPKAEYYARGQADHVHRYEIDRMLGIWKDRDCVWGPWTDDVRGGLHTGETLAPEGDRDLVQKAQALGLPAIEVD